MSGANRPLPALGARTTVVVVDMQAVFSARTAWHVPKLSRIIPRVTRLALHRPDRTILTRFITPITVAAAKGAWRRYYRHWSSVTLERMKPEQLELIGPLAKLAGQMEVCEKTTFSAFESRDFVRAIARRRTDTIVIAGIETEVCVLATALAGVDRGLHVVVASDAVASSSAEAHAAVFDVILPRFVEQIHVAPVRQILAAWRG